MVRRIALGALLMVSLAACGIPIVHNTDTGVTTSSASYTVTPTTVTTATGDQAGITITIVNCNTWVLNPGGTTGSFRPIASVADSSGTILFANSLNANLVIPDGATVVAGSGSTASVITVPLGKTSGAYTVSAGCTTYPGFGSGPYLLWSLTPCTTDESNGCGPISTGTWQGP